MNKTKTFVLGLVLVMLLSVSVSAFSNERAQNAWMQYQIDKQIYQQRFYVPYAQMRCYQLEAQVTNMVKGNWMSFRDGTNRKRAYNSKANDFLNDCQDYATWKENLGVRLDDDHRYYNIGTRDLMSFLELQGYGESKTNSPARTQSVDAGNGRFYVSSSFGESTYGN